MNKTNKYALNGQWLFALMVVCILATVYAAQTRLTVLMFICVIISIILSLGLLILLLKLNKAFEENEQEIVRLRQHDNHIRMQKEQQSAYNDRQQQQVEAFKVDEALSRIIPAPDVCFDNTTAYTEKILQNIAKELGIVQGLLFVLNDVDQLFHISGEYAYFSDEQPRSFPLGETLSGQVAKNQQLLSVKELPEDYITILSGLGKSNPRHLVIVPIICSGKSIGVMELASFKPFGENEELFIRKTSELMANQLNKLRN